MQNIPRSSATSRNQPKVIWEGDPETLNYLYLAPEVEQLFGYTVAQWMETATFWQERVHPDDREKVVAALRQGEGGKPFVLSYRFALANGRFIWIDDHIHPLPERGRLLGIKEIRPSSDEEPSISPSEAIDFINQTLFVQGTFRERLEESLNVLGQALGLTAVYILENEQENMADRLLLRYTWEGGKTAVSFPFPSQNLSYHSLGLQETIPHLQRGQVATSTTPPPAPHLALAAAPITQQNRWQGVILCYAEPASRVWLPIEIEAITTMASLLSAALRRVRSYEQTQQKLSQTTEQLQAAEALNEIARHLNSTLELDEVLQRTVDALRRYLTNVQGCSLTILEDQGTVMRMRAQWVEKPEYSLLPIGQSRIIAETHVVKEALQTRKPVWVGDLAADPVAQSYPYTRIATSHGLRSVLYIPIIIHDEPIGLIHVNAWVKPRHFTNEEIALCQSVANQAALAIESARLFQAELRRRREAETLREVAGYLSSTLDLSAILDQTLQAVRRYLANVHSCLLSILDEDGKTLLAQAEWFDQPHHSVRRFGTRINLNETILARQVVEEKRVVVIDDTTTLTPSYDQSNQLLVSGVRSLLYLPLLSKGTAVGILHISVWDEPRRFLPQEISLCQGVANQAAAAIENARLYAAAQAQLAQRNALLRATTVMSTSLEMATILSKLAEQLVQALDASNAYIVRSGYQANAWNTVASHSVMEATEQSSIWQNNAPVFVDEAVNHKILRRLTRQEAYICYIDDPQLLPWEQRFLQRRQIKSFVTVPLFVEGRFWGGAVVMEHRRQREFLETDLALAFGMTQQASVAIERANLYAQLQEYADHLAEEVAARTAELQAERDRTLAILESAGEGIILTDVEATILYANPAIEQQTGYSREELLGQNVRIFASSQTPTAVNNAMWEPILRGENWSGTFVNRRKNGTLYDVSLTITPTLSSNGQINGFVSVQADISRLKELDRLKSEFVSNVSHELRTPLTNIKTYLTLVERGRSEKQPHYLKVLNEESDRLGRLIQDLLDLSRLETETLPERIEPSDLKRQLFKQIDAFAVKASQKHISIRLDLPDDLPLLRVSDNHLGQLFTNLFGNSINYIQEHGNVVVQADVVTKSGQQRMVVIRFQDDGPGIPLEERANVFDRFYRGKGIRNRGIPGTGLGLAICKEIVERYGGRIELDQRVMVGATFVVQLPAVK